MSVETFKNHMKRGVVKASIAAGIMAGHIDAKAQEQPQKDNNQTPKTEEVLQPSVNEQKKGLNFLDVAKVDEVKEDGKSYQIINDKAIISPEMLNEKKLKKEYKQEEKELWRNPQPDRIHQDTVSLSEITFGATYNQEDKSVNIPYIKDDMTPNATQEISPELKKLSARAAEQNDPQSLGFASMYSHENQHRKSDKLGVYAPGLSAEQYAMLNQYEEISSNVAGLYSYVNAYKAEREKGAPIEQALSVFDNASVLFQGYKEVLKNGVDPDSKEGKALMVSTCVEGWKKDFASEYKSQFINVGQNGVEGNSFQSLVLGNDDEMQKRVKKIFDNIVVDGKTVSIPVPQQELLLEAEVFARIGHEVQSVTGLSQADREKISQNVSGKNSKQKLGNFIQKLRGLSKGKDASKPKSEQEVKEVPQGVIESARTNSL